MPQEMTLQSFQESLVADVIQSLADHYSQPIHLSTTTTTSSSSKDSINDVPYFDPLLGKPLSLSPITRHWLQHLIHVTTSTSSSSSLSNNELGMQCVVIASLMKSYEMIIRDKCFDGSTTRRRQKTKTLQVQANAAIILIQYEQLLNKYKEYCTLQKDNNGSDNDNTGKVVLSCDHDDQEETRGRGEKEEYFYATISNAIERIALDIFSLSAMYICRRDDTMDDPTPDSDCDSSFDDLRRLRNMILPILLKIMQHMIDLLMHGVVTMMIMDSTTRSQRKNVAKVKYCIAVATLVALAFCKDCSHVQRNGDDDDSNKEGSLSMLLTSSSDLKVWEIEDLKRLLIQHGMTWKHMFMDQSTFAPTHVKDYEKYLDGLFQFANSNKEGESSDNHQETSSLSSSSSSSSLLSFMDRSMVDFQLSTASTIPSNWIDPTNGIGTRTATALLQQIAKLSLWLLNNDENAMGKDHGNQHKTALNHGKCFGDIILDAVGSEIMCQMARALFFGRLASSNTKTAVEQSREEDCSSSTLFKSLPSHDLAFNGIVTSKKRLDVDETKTTNLDSQAVFYSNHTKNLITRNILEYTDSEPFKEVPALAVAAIRVTAALKFPNVTSKVLDDTIPVAFTLIDSYTEYHQAFGAAILWNILTQVTPTCFVSSAARSGDDDAGKDNRNSYFENTQKVLSVACRTCKHSLSLCLLNLARSKLFEMAPTKDANKLRRDAVSESYDWIQKNSFAGPGAEPESLEVLFICLVSCVQPLLHELAQLPEAGAMELGRAGLTMLLPLIRWDSNTLWGRKVQVASMECLLSLMMGAYPIMERHGGKIMSELISCVGRLQRDVTIQNKVQSHGLDHDENDELLATKTAMAIALHVASAALVLCGRKAEEVLIKIENGSYTKSLVDACSVIRSSAEIMKK